MRSLLLILTMVLPSLTLASFPENDLYLEDDINRRDANLTQEQFNQIIDHVASYYTPIVESHGATLQFEKNWEDTTVNAYANQTGNTWTVAMFGGLARRPEITADGFAIVICHELGHHLGGFPFMGLRWAASEGQSDYYATAVCAKKLWRNQAQLNAQYRELIPEYMKTQCDAVNLLEEDQNLCYRVAMAAKSTADLLAEINDSESPFFETPDPSVVESTQTSHPHAQCRLDTYASGALCNESFPDFEIPGRNHPEGQGSLAAERLASLASCVEARFFDYGLRPRCWFAPRIALSLAENQLSLIELIGNGNGVWEPGESYGINVPLINRLFTPLEDAILTVEGPDFISVEPAYYPTIEEGQTLYANSNAVVMVSPETACGEHFTLRTQAIWGPMIMALDIPIKLGNQTISDAPGLVIPDDTSMDVSTYLDYQGEGTTSLITVALDITHSYIGDLQITLLTPSGKEYLFYDRQGGGTDNIKDHFDIPIDPEDVSGTWGLRLADKAYSDQGTLNSWTLDLNVSICE